MPLLLLTWVLCVLFLLNPLFLFSRGSRQGVSGDAFRFSSDRGHLRFQVGLQAALQPYRLHGAKEHQRLKA